jgi:hypothetical protein
MITIIDHLLNVLNSSLIFNAVIMLLMNVGGKYIVKEIPPSVDKIFENQLARQFLIFCMVFVATRNIQVSIFLTIMFIIIMNVLLNENSKYCILPSTILDSLDTNQDGKISHDEIVTAQKMLSEYIAKVNKTQNTLE